ncbi:MAG: tRNA uridine-5-carboxymethylaminomethyl(34) synthesis GTPase MnmE [Chloroflexota bacterium]|nr:tRNA uridine-5-carboxymethylaminomethyl(34) synthesis GTPase MnmE [Chloroflexota bacterium]
MVFPPEIRCRRGKASPAKKMYSDTIVAVGTPSGEGGIGVVRMSGALSSSILARIFQPPSGICLNAEAISSHMLMYGFVIDPASGERSDEVMVVLMRAPRSYTREDVVEISCHGGPVPLQIVLALCLTEGARLAEPGEFTLRAFLNGRLDLAQAEAVLDVVQARTVEGLKIAVSHLGGGLSGRVKPVRAELLHALAHLEANIDFPEDDVPPADVSPDLKRAISALDELLAGADTGIVMKQGVRTALVGRPNVGKSSLLNALLRKERAIVTPIAGTTRDTLEEVANVRGVPFVLTDTAGLREEASHDPIESIGMDRTRQAAHEAALIILIFDGAVPLSSADYEAIKSVGSSSATRIAVVNKSDLPNLLDCDDLQIALPGVEIVHASATEPGGTDLLEKKLAETVLSGRATPDKGEAVVSSIRHKDALQRARQHATAALQAQEEGLAAALLAVDLHAALVALGEITGESVGEDLLDEIFRNFCIGK